MDPDLPNLDNKHDNTKLILIIFIGALFLIGLGFLIYSMTRPKESNAPSGAPVPPTPPTPPVPPVPPTPTLGLWARDPGSGYANGLSYADSLKYCTENNGILATKNQLLTANQKGFEYCAAGWLAGQDAGYVMASSQPGCGVIGFNQWIASDPNSKLSTYCYGIIPSQNDVGKSIQM
ncbi:putative neurocan core protein [Tupanvirus deep ocean]|uniref:Neurocan core protein n=2 Tax=Tupanvirus TaxID=2094720 RepID=A0AC62A977_9VIRU|nr:putative neurocan core protein [Tupanvirus deep ocean]QKU34331.1 putative neurocan core protein [Tupanvirus deep ocean]